MHRLLLALLLSCSLISAADEPAWKYEKTVASFEAKDKEAPPTPGTIAFIGSSTFTMWKGVATDMAPLPVYNRAFGGSRTADMLKAYPRLLLPNKPKVIVYYCGDNDMASGATADPAVPVKGFTDFVAAVRADLPKTRIVYASIKPSSSRIAAWPKVQIANAQLQEFCAKDPLLTFVDIGKSLLDAEGKPNDALYIKDRLHLNAEGYKLVTAVLKPAVEKAWKDASAE